MKTCTLFCCALLAAAAMQAQIIHVPGDYPTIQQGIDAADSGDVVLVDEGIYYEQINFKGKRWLTVASMSMMDGDTSHNGHTIIDGSLITDPDSASVVYFVSGEDTTSVLCGFTIQHGKGTSYILDGYPVRAGGGVFISGSGAKIIHNHITENHLNDTVPGIAKIVTGAGLACEFKMEDHWIIIDNNVISHNSCYSSGLEASGAGFGVCYNSRITNNIISHNTSTGTSTCEAFAAGFYCSADWEAGNLVTAVVQHNFIENNLAEAEDNYASNAGALLQAVTGLFSGNKVSGNITISGTDAGTQFHAATGIFSDNKGTGNATKSGTNSGGCAGISIVAPREGVVVSNNIFSGNVSSEWAGGLAIEPWYTNPEYHMVLVENNYFINNEAKNGGGFASLRNPAILQNNVFSGNRAIQNGGGTYIGNTGILNSDHLVQIVNNSFYENLANVYGGAIYTQGLTDLLVINSVFWNDADKLHNIQEIYILSGFDTLEITHSNINPLFVFGNVADGGGNIKGDPLFEDPVLLTIPENSLCLNSGTEDYACQCGDTHHCPAYDIDGKPRPLWGGFDMGAHEWDFPAGYPEISGTITGIHCITYPNPFSGLTTFSYELAKSSNVHIMVFDTFGQLIAEPVNANQPVGEQRVQWNSGNLPAGMYYYRVEADGRVGTGKMVKW